jgi:hypothetical protein
MGVGTICDHDVMIVPWMVIVGLSFSANRTFPADGIFGMEV